MNSPQLVVQGQVVSISGDLLKDEHTGMTYYLARVQVTGEGLKGWATASCTPACRWR